MNKKPRVFPMRSLCCLASLSLLIGCAGPGAKQAPAPAAAAPVAASAPTQRPTAEALLKDMARFLSAAPRFSVEVKGHFDVLQDTGQMLEFGENRWIAVSRPDRFRVETEQSDGNRHAVFYDGKDITVYSPGQQVYAQTAKPGGIDAAVKYFLHDLHMRLPLALLLLSDLPKELEARTETLAYVEKTRIDGQPAHHIAGRTATVDYQFWIAEGSEPLPLRVVLTYKTVEGEPQFRGQFSNWNLAPAISEAEFAFKPPEGARKIAFLAKLPELRDQAGPATTGEQK